MKHASHAIGGFLVLVICAGIPAAPFPDVSPRDIEGIVISIAETELCGFLGREEGVCDTRPGYTLVLGDVTARWSDTTGPHTSFATPDTGSFDTLSLVFEAAALEDPENLEGKNIKIYRYDFAGDEFSMRGWCDSLVTISLGVKREDTRNHTPRHFNISRHTQAPHYLMLNGRAVHKTKSSGVFIHRPKSTTTNPTKHTILQERTHK